MTWQASKNNHQTRHHISIFMSQSK
uniref:Uncharacterized protein n=1 Tax=Rhizophora mucronata TaxID=61149 RepID=A0A2P2QU40_RHIMU